MVEAMIIMWSDVVLNVFGKMHKNYIINEGKRDGGK
jgi:hypothetical protein